jgi:glyoxylase-like metal-dependent hydrolase (beta-lactamase superfamily II)/rhodanese-related sulfurtransferase
MPTVLFEQYVEEGLGCASYVIGDEQAGEAIVVDPAYDVSQYLEIAERKGVRLTRVLETHTHADHVSGHGRLALEHGLSVAIHPEAAPAYPFEPLEDGAEIEVGQVALRVIHTPGHRAEHCCFAVIDRSRAPEPWLVFTGDSLLVGDAARPDLAVEATEGAEGLFHSLRRLLELPDGVELYPGHVAGSLCGAGMSSKASSTIGFERRFNPSLAHSDIAEFIAESAAASGTPRPPNMERIVELNRGPFIGSPAPLTAVSSPAGATVLDVRDTDAFARGHVPGAINIPVGGSFSTKAGFVLSGDEHVVLYASSEDDARRGARGLQAVGLFNVDGFLTGVDASERLEPLTLDDLEQMMSNGGISLVDVREKDERDHGYIPESLHIPYRRMRACADELRGNSPVVTICESGSRASTAASILVAAGVDARPVLGEGVSAWRQRGGQCVEFRRCGS